MNLSDRARRVLAIIEKSGDKPIPAGDVVAATGMTWSEVDDGLLGLMRHGVIASVAGHREFDQEIEHFRLRREGDPPYKEPAALVDAKPGQEGLPIEAVITVLRESLAPGGGTAYGPGKDYVVVNDEIVASVKTHTVTFSKFMLANILRRLEEIPRLQKGHSDYAERINADARDCAYRDRLIEKMRAALRDAHPHVPWQVSHEIAFLLELPTSRKDDAYVSGIDKLHASIHAINEALFDASGEDVEHQIASHADRVPELARRLGAAIRKAMDVVQPIVQDWRIQ